MAKVTLPKSLLDLPEQDRNGIVAVLLEASKLPKEKTLPHRMAGDEHNVWERNGDGLLADAEDELYYELADAEAQTIGELIGAMDLPLPGDMQKSFEASFHAFEDELLKAKDSGRNKMSRFIQTMADVARQKRDSFMKWMNNGKALTPAQMKQIDRVLATKAPEYLKKRAESYVTRAAFIGKVRGEAEKQGFEVMGAYVDRFPESITAGVRDGVVLTPRRERREKERAEKKAQKKAEKVKILPLTPLESEAVKHAALHAGDKITEISMKHMAAVRQMVMVAKKERWTAERLASALLDKFGDHNRDWRRVAITELAFAANDAYLAGCSEGDTLVGMGAVNACKHCQRLIIGKEIVFRSAQPERETNSTDIGYVWVGKTNYGRKVSEYVAAIPLHPHCRCRWHRISRFYKMGKDGKLELKSTAELINEERAKRGLAPDTSLPTGQVDLKAQTEALLRKMGQ